MHIHSSRFTQHALAPHTQEEHSNACAACLPDPHILASDRMSRSEMAYLPRVFPTASQVLTKDTKITKSEANIFNFLADDAFPAVAGAFLPTAWHRCAGCSLADGGHFYCSGALKLGTPTRSERGRTTLRA